MKRRIIFNNQINTFIKKYAHQNFSYQEALDFGFKPSQFYKLVHQGYIERFERGFYRFKLNFPTNYEKQFTEFSKLIPGKSAICLTTSLSYYQLSDDIVQKPIFLVSHSFKSKKQSIHLFRKRNPYWSVGITQKKGFCITSLERTIVESMIYKKWTGHEGFTALKKAVTKGKTDIFQVIELSKKLGYSRRLAPYFEVFL